MLRWADKPTAMFNEFLDYAFDLTIGEVDTAIMWMKEGYAKTNDDVCIANFYDGELDYFENLEVLKKALLDLQKGHKSHKLYMPTDWQFFILDRMISGVCIHLNDLGCDTFSKKAMKKYGVVAFPSFLRKRDCTLKNECDYDFITLKYFWDLDHDIYLTTYKIVPKFTKGCKDLKLTLHR